MRFAGPIPIVATLAAAAILLAVAAGCKDSNTVTGQNVPTPTPSPTPAPAANIAGSWRGSFTTNDEADCPSDPAARATFVQDGSVVTGQIVTNSCGFGGHFQGTLVGDRLAGTLTKGAFGPTAASGTADSSEIGITVRDLRSGNQLMPGGRLELHR